MKKVLTLFALVIILGFISEAKAGTNSGTEFAVKNGKDEPTVTESKDTKQYSFTLFNFFLGNDKNVKSDSVQVKSPAVEPPVKKVLN